MKLRLVTVTTVGVLWCGSASAGGLFLPGAGAVSTARAGASVAATDDGEAISLNPAGIAKVKGTMITFGIVAIDYLMSFQRDGNYPSIMQESTTYAGKPFPLVTNQSQPPLGIGAFQPVPVIAIISDLGGRIPGLHVGFGVYAPNAYPFRDMNQGNYFVPDAKAGYQFPTFGQPPPPTRYDIVHEEAAVILPSLAVAYRVMPQLDIGARFSAGIASLKSTVAVWGLQNHEEWIQQDGLFSLDAKGVVTTGALGATYRPTPTIELGTNIDAPIFIHAHGDATSVNGPAVSLAGTPVVITPVPDDAARCEKGGTAAAQKGCVDVELPWTVTVGGRYKFLDGKGAMKGDVELDVGWEHWGAKCDYITDPNCLNPSDFHVNIDAQVGTASMPNGLTLKPQLIAHGLQDTYSVRVGGSYVIPTGDNAFIARGGVSYDSAAASPGWERADLDGAARTMLAGGASYKLPRFQFDAGFGLILEGTRSSSRGCQPTGNPGNAGCGPGGTEQSPNGFELPGPYRQGPDPINPILSPNVQAEHPVNEGTFKSHYLMVMLGVSTWF